MSTMIQNPNEIEAFTRRQRALARIHRNIAEKFQLNRRQFISGSLATMALAALGLSGCAPKTPAASTGDAAPAFTPGTYEATAQGRNGEIKVSVTFEADRIASIEADHMESRNIGDAAVRLLTDNYLDTQKLSVDTVTGATLTSMAFATAVAECAEAAGADMRAIMKGDASVNAAEPITDEADVVVIGSGGAALAAAVTAAEAGKSVVMLEKMDIYGGNTNAGAGLRNMELVQIHPLGDPQNGGVATFVGNWLGVEDYVMVNDDAVRFVREDERRDTIADAILEQPNDEMWLLVDSTNIKDDRLEEIADLVAKGHSFKADTIEDLATQIGVDPSTLAETIEGYNACVAAGKDTQIAPGKELLGDAVSDPSFYASKRIPTIHYTMGGVCISPEAQVLTAAGEAIPGLFAAGEVTGGVQGANRLGGNSYTDLIVFGRIAGASAAAAA